MKKGKLIAENFQVFYKRKIEGKRADIAFLMTHCCKIYCFSHDLLCIANFAGFGEDTKFF